MNRLFASLFFLFPVCALAEEAAQPAGFADKYYMFIGLVLFLALFGVYTIFERMRDVHEAKVERMEEEARRLRIENDEREEKLKSENIK